MLNVSAAAAQAIADGRGLVYKANLKLLDGTTYELDGTNFLSMSFEKSCSPSGTFEFGTAISGSLSMRLVNDAGQWDSTSFVGAEVTAYTGIPLGDTVEWVQQGVYGIQQPDAYGPVISLEAMDNLRYFEFPFSDATWPTGASVTVGQVVARLCQTAGLTLDTPTFPGSTIVVVKPGDEALTALAAMAYLAQMGGCNVRCTPNGHVKLVGYSTASPVEPVRGYTSLSVRTEDVTLTGVRVIVAAGEDEDEDHVVLTGTEGYVIEVEGNPFVTVANMASVGPLCPVGLTFRPFECSQPNDPRVEPGDCIDFEDANGNGFRSIVTRTSFGSTGAQVIACDAESTAEKNAAGFSPGMKAITEVRNSIRREHSERVIAIDDLSEQLADSSGLYTTAVRQQDDSYIYYFHDKADMASSDIIWKVTAEAMAVSTNGGQTYATGLTADGTAILNRVYAIGIDADYITTGTITDRLGLNSIDLDTGEVYFSSIAGDISDANAAAEAASLKATARYATSSTTAGTAAKVAACTGFTLFTGAVVSVQFSTANTADAPTLNVNSTGAKAIWVNNAVTSSTNPLLWSANTLVTFVYDGTRWRLVDVPASYSLSSTTAAGTAAKTATSAGIIIVNGSVVNVRFGNANTANAPTLNIGSTGAVAINVNGAAASSTNKLLWDAGQTLGFTRSGAGWHVNDSGGVNAASYVRAYGNGVLVGRQGQTVGALVNADGSFDVVTVTWSGNTPTAGTTLASFSSTEIQLAKNSTAGSINIANGRAHVVGASISTSSLHLPTFEIASNDGSYIAAASIAISTTADGARFYSGTNGPNQLFSDGFICLYDSNSSVLYYPHATTWTNSSGTEIDDGAVLAVGGLLAADHAVLGPSGVDGTFFVKNRMYLHEQLCIMADPAIIRAKTTNRNAEVLRVYGAADANGDAVVMGDGGLIIVGGGESAVNLYDALVTNGSWAPGSEYLVLGADGGVYIMPNCQTVANRKEWQFTTGAELVGPNGGNFCPNGTNGQLYMTSGEDSNGKKMQIALSGANTVPQFRLHDGSAWGSWTGLAVAGHTHNYLPLSGGTLTGNLNRKNADMDTSAASLTAQQYSIVGFTDANDRYVAYLQASENTSGTSLLDVAVRRYNSSANQTHYFRMGMDKSSNATVSFSHPAAWRSGLGVAPVQLYNNTGNGINTAVTLSDSVANFTRIKVYFKDNNHKKCPCQEFYGLAASDTFSIYDVEASSATTTYVRRTYYTVSSNGKTLTPSLGGDFGVNHSSKTIGAATTTATNELYIYRVEGYGY